MSLAVDTTVTIAPIHTHQRRNDHLNGQTDEHWWNRMTEATRPRWATCSLYPSFFSCAQWNWRTDFKSPESLKPEMDSWCTSFNPSIEIKPSVLFCHNGAWTISTNQYSDVRLPLAFLTFYPSKKLSSRQGNLKFMVFSQIFPMLKHTKLWMLCSPREITGIRPPYGVLWGKKKKIDSI